MSEDVDRCMFGFGGKLNAEMVAEELLYAVLMMG